MYALKSITNEILEFKPIGNEFSVVWRETNYDVFRDLYLDEFAKPHYAGDDMNADEVSKNIAGFVCWKGGQKPFFKGGKYEVVNADTGIVVTEIKY